MEEKKHHFLYYIFKADKAENPMPKEKAESLAQKIAKILKSINKEKGKDK